ncbi:MAG: YciI family protein [Myxococcota bacterium]
MQYLLLFNKDEAKFRALSAEARAELIARYNRFGTDMLDANIMGAGAALDATDTATTLRIRDGKRLVTDGPFAETTEQIAGFCLIDVENLDAALAWAERHPDAEWGSVEVRPVVHWSPPR